MENDCYHTGPKYLIFEIYPLPVIKFFLHTMPYTFRYQPLKGLYLTYQLIITLIIRLPLWVLLSLPR